VDEIRERYVSEEGVEYITRQWGPCVSEGGVSEVSNEQCAGLTGGLLDLLT
jgi:hypothetical protein